MLMFDMALVGGLYILLRCLSFFLQPGEHKIVRWASVAVAAGVVVLLVDMYVVSIRAQEMFRLP